MNEIVTVNASDLMEQVIIKGDLSKLSPIERADYYRAVCDSLGLNPLTTPFGYIVLNGKLQLYAKKDATEQLRKKYKVSITKLEKETIDGVFCVTAYATDSTGRTDIDIGAVNINGLKGEAYANAHMKAITKAKRRVTLSICGLGMLDESEADSVPNALIVEGDSQNYISQVNKTNVPPVESFEEQPVAVVEYASTETTRLIGQKWSAHFSRPIKSADVAEWLHGEGIGTPLTVEGAKQALDKLTDLMAQETTPDHA